MTSLLAIVPSHASYAQSDDMMKKALDSLDAAIGVLEKSEEPSSGKIPPPTLLSPSGSVPGAEQQAVQRFSWQTYHNSRFGTHIDFPSDLLTVGYSSLNGDGVTLQTKDGLMELKVFAGYNVFERSIKQHEEWLRGELSGDVTYSAEGNEWFVLSGTVDGNIFYEKRFLSAEDDVIHGFRFVYPASQKVLLAPVVERLSHSFMALRSQSKIFPCVQIIHVEHSSLQILCPSQS